MPNNTLNLRKLLINGLYTILLFISSFFASCDDDTVTPPPPDPGIQVVDSNIFNWRFIPVPVKNFWDYYVIDTNNIYYAGDERLYYYNGISSVLLFGETDASVQQVEGYNTNNVYFGGARRIGNGTIYPFFKKWNGSNVENIPVPQDSGYSIAAIHILSANNIWLGAERGRLYNYINDTVITYQINLSFSPSLTYFFGDGNNLYYYFYHSGNNMRTHYVYKFNNTNWIEIFSDITNDNLVYGTRTSIINNSILRNRIKSIDIFENNTWQEKVKTPTFEPYVMAGPSQNEFLCSGIVAPFFYTYYFDGSKWLYQSDMPYPENNFYSFGLDIAYADNTYFGFYYPLDHISHNYILIGNFK